MQVTSSTSLRLVLTGESLEEVEQYGMAIIQACVAQHCTHVLCNELDLEYRLASWIRFSRPSILPAWPHGWEKWPWCVMKNS